MSTLDDPRRLRLLRLGILASKLGIAAGIAGVTAWLVRSVGPQAWHDLLASVGVFCLALAFVAYLTGWGLRIYVGRADRGLSE